jgi:uncharacterized protein DUF3237
MRLDLLGEMELVYRDSSFGEKFILTRPFGGEEGSGYGEGEGTIKGERITGTLRWVNHPHRRSDGSMLPDAHGIIKTADGAIVHFVMQGRTVWVGEAGRQLLSVTFESQDERYKWLNNTYCVLEGAIDSVALKMRSRVYLCVSDFV